MCEYLLNWYKENNIEQRFSSSFWAYFDGYRIEDPEEFSAVFQNGKDVYIKLDRLAFEVELPNYENKVISVCADICINDKKVGWFKIIYLLAGEEFDDYFVID